MSDRSSQHRPRNLALPPYLRGPLSVSLLLLSLATSARAQPLFRAPALLYDTGSTPASVAVADLNGDGRQDLAVTNSAVYSEDRRSTISVFLGRGDGTFAARTDFDVASTPQMVAIADVNEDGRPDLLAATYGDSPGFAGTICVLLGNGDGTFATAVAYDGGIKLRSLAITDLNGDGHLDVVSEKTVLLGRGDGTFGAKIEFGTWRDYWAAVADLNGDGRPDLVTSNPEIEPDAEDMYAVSVRLSNGDGTFGAAAGYGTGYYALAVTIADVNADGRADVAVANFGSSPDDNGSVSVLLGNGDGTFGTQRFFATGNNPIAVAIADVNGDGRPDLATANLGADPDFDSNSVTVLLGNGDGTFRRTPDLHVGENPRSVAIADLDGDRVPDLVAVNQMSNSVSVLLGNGDGSFGSPDLGVGGRPTSVAIADFNRDGRADLATANGGTWPNPVGGVSVLLGNGNGTFGSRLDFSAGAYPGSLAASDLNGDGWPDLAIAEIGFEQTHDAVHLWFGNGDGTFRAGGDLAAGAGPSAVAIADLNVDGRPDLAVVDCASSRISVLPGNGDGTFGARTEFATARQPWAIVIADLDVDGRPDIVTANVGYLICVLRGNGDGSFGPHADFNTANLFANTGQVAAGDVNADGWPDVVVGNSVLLGNGDGTLREGLEFDRVKVFDAPAIADFDGDGRQDLATLSSDVTGKVSIRLGNGDGTFGPGRDFGVGPWPDALVSADLNADGRPDLVVANNGSYSLSLLLSQGPPPVALAFELAPNTLNLGSQGRWVTGALTPAPPHSARDIDVASIRLNGSVPVDVSAPVALRDENGDGVRDLLVKFDRAALARTVAAGQHVAVTVTGVVGSEAFSGTDTIRVLAASGRSPVTDESDQADGASRFVLAIRGTSPNPAASGHLRLGFTLRDKSPARLDLLDVAGRVLVSRQVGALGPGAHELDLAAGGALRPGIYFLRLTQGGSEVRARAVVVR